MVLLLRVETCCRFVSHLGAGLGLLVLAGAQVQAGEPFEGHGAVTAGAESCPTTPTDYVVTSLADDGSPGTLRDALHVASWDPTTIEAKGCRRVTFAVAGTITLESDLFLRSSYVTIDGSTAPEPGVTITQSTDSYAGLLIQATRHPVRDIVITHLRFDGVHDEPGHDDHRVGDAILSFDADCSGVPAEFRCEGAWTDDPDRGLQNVVLDHLTIATLRDKTTFWGKVRNVTVSNCFFYRSPLAFLLSFYAGATDLERRGFSVHHNLFSQNNERNPQVRGWVDGLDFRNNVIHAYDHFNDRDSGDWPGDGYGLRIRNEDGERSVNANLVANVFHDTQGVGERALIYGTNPGADATDGGPADCLSQGDVHLGSTLGELWVADNVFPPGACDVYSTVAAERSAAPVTTHATSELCALLTARVGPTWRTTVEEEIVDAVRVDLGCDVAATPGLVPDGAAVVGEPLRVRWDAGTGSALLSWGSSCALEATDYVVREGAIGDFTGHGASACSTGGATNHALVPSFPGSYFLVAARTDALEGGVGVDGQGVVRPVLVPSCAAVLSLEDCR
ncbi:MAG: hypothetical protein AAF533_03255 [Acidobacteriota bacterium]